MKQINVIINKIIDYFSIIMIFSITMFILLQILFRFIGIQASWTIELVRFLFVFLVFFASVLAISEKEHIVITTLVDKLPKNIQLYMYIFVQILIVIFLLLFIRGNLNLASSTNSVTLVSMKWFKVSYVYIGIITASVLMILNIIYQVFNSIFKVERSESE